MYDLYISFGCLIISIGITIFAWRTNNEGKKLQLFFTILIFILTLVHTLSYIFN
jgi:hypothetical protein